MDNTLATLAATYNTSLSKLMTTIAPESRNLSDLERHTLARLDRQRKICIISGLSGAGKSTVGNILTNARFQKIPNVTTRKKRPNETDADYVFLDEPTFHSWNEQHRFALTKKTNGASHGFLQKHIDLLQQPHEFYYIDKSVSSAIALSKLLPREHCNFIFLLPPSFETLYQRVTTREQQEHSLTEADIFARFEEEIHELSRSTALPYAYIINDSLDRVQQILL